jgi:hypothetical protein
MVQTDDPLLKGPVPPPEGTRLNTREQRSASDPTVLVGDHQRVVPEQHHREQEAAGQT